MAQGQLVGFSGIGTNGEGTRKRLKISVPHFDNSAFIKSFSKTLIGRCMNPPEQDMKALFQNLPKIWKLENMVTGSDLGFGRFQFVFEREEDIEVVLRNQPYHFDYWMLALARWQPMKDQKLPFGDTILDKTGGGSNGASYSSHFGEHWGCYRQDTWG